MARRAERPALFSVEADRTIERVLVVLAVLLGGSLVLVQGWKWWVQ